MMEAVAGLSIRALEAQKRLVKAVLVSRGMTTAITT